MPNLKKLDAIQDATVWVRLGQIDMSGSGWVQSTCETT